MLDKEAYERQKKPPFTAKTATQVRARKRKVQPLVEVVEPGVVAGDIRHVEEVAYVVQYRRGGSVQGSRDED